MFIASLQLLILPGLQPGVVGGPDGKPFQRFFVPRETFEKPLKRFRLILPTPTPG